MIKVQIKQMSAQLLIYIDQVEFCDVLVLNKTDLVTEAELTKLENILRKLQPDASN